MSLSCDCDIDWSPEPGDLSWCDPGDFTKLKTKKRRRCKSCKSLINVGSDVAKFERYRTPSHVIDIVIYGEDGEIPLAPHYLCDECAGLYFSLKDLGYCMHYADNMRDLVAEYANMQRTTGDLNVEN